MEKGYIANGYLVIWVVVWNSGIPEIKLMMTLVDTRLPRVLEQPPKHIEEWFIRFISIELFKQGITFLSTLW